MSGTVSPEGPQIANRERAPPSATPAPSTPREPPSATPTPSASCADSEPELRSLMERSAVHTAGGQLHHQSRGLLEPAALPDALPDALLAALPAALPAALLAAALPAAALPGAAVWFCATALAYATAASTAVA